VKSAGAGKGLESGLLFHGKRANNSVASTEKNSHSMTEGCFFNGYLLLFQLQYIIEVNVKV